MDFKGFMLSEKGERKTYIVCSHVYAESKKVKLTEIRVQNGGFWALGKMLNTGYELTGMR